LNKIYSNFIKKEDEEKDTYYVGLFGSKHCVVIFKPTFFWWRIVFKQGLDFGLFITQGSFANKYSLIRKEDGNETIEDIGDWIITDKYIYGVFKTSQKYFLLNRESAHVETFPIMRDLSQKLRQLGMKPYDMSDEESFVHLKYHKRVYTLRR